MKNKYILSAALVTLFATISANAQEGFGTNSPDPSSVIDMVSTKRGVLIPRVKLSATNLATPVTAPANALLVYNELAAGTAPNNVVPGFYYWITNRWVRITNVDDIIKGSITSTDIVVTDGNDATFKDVQLAIANDAITTNKIAPGAVETSDIKDRAVTPAKLDGTGFTAGYVATVQANGSVTYAAPSATATNITSDKNLTAGDASIVIGGTGTGALLQNANVSVADLGITNAKLAADAVTNAKLADNAVQTENIKDHAVTAIKLDATGATPGNVATVGTGGVVTYEPLNADNLSNGKALTSTDISVSGNGATALLKAVTIDIKPNAVTAAKINADVAGAGLSQDATGALQIATDGITAAMINPNVAGSGLTQDASGALQVNTAAIATGDITGGTEITVGNGADSAFKDVTLGIADNAVTSAKIANGTIIAEDLAAGSVPSTKLIADGTNDAGKVATVNSNGTVTYQPVSTANLADKKDLTAYTNATTDVVPSIEVASGGTNAVLVATSLKVADSGITTGKLAADAVTNAKLADNAVQTENIAVGAVETSDIKDGAVTAIKLAADGTNDAGKVATVNSNGTVTYQTIAADAANVTNGKALTSTDLSVSAPEGATALLKAVTIDIKPNAVTAAKINADVAGAGLSQDATGALQIAADGVTAAMINPNVAGSGLTQDASGALQVNTAAIATGDITGGTEVTVGNGTDSAFKDVTLGIANNAITNAKMADDAIGSAEIINGSITGADIAPTTVTAGNLTGGTAAANSVATTDGNGVVTFQPVSTANLANKGSLQNPTGEAVLSITIANGTDALLKNAQISVADGGITTGKLAADAVTNAKLADNAVQTENIAANAVETSDIKDGAVTAIKLSAEAADANKVATAHANGTVTYENVSTANLADKKDLTAYTNATTDVVPSIEVASGGTNAVLVATSLKVADSGITTGKIAADAVTNAKLADNAVQTENIAANAVETSDIKDGAVTAIKLAADGTNDAGKVATVNSDGTVTYQTIAADAANVTNGKALTSTDLSVSAPEGATALLKAVTIDIKPNAVTEAKINTGAVTTTKLADDAVTAAKINADVAGAGLSQDATGALQIAADGVTATMINPNVAGAGLTQDASGALQVNTAAIATGDITGGTEVTVGNGTDSAFKDVTLGIANNAITNAKMADDAIGSAEIINGSITGADIAPTTVTAGNLTGGTAAANSVATTDGNGVVTFQPVSTANLANKGSLQNPTGEAVLSITIANGTDALLKNAQISVADGGITTGKLAADAVTNAKLADNAVQTENIAAGAVETSDIKDGAVTAIKLSAEAADANKVATAHANGTVTYENVSTANLADKKDLTAYTNATTDVVPSIEVAAGGTNAVLVATSLKVADGGITTGKLAADAVTNAKLADNAVQTENIAAGAVETSDIKDGAVTAIKLNSTGAAAGKVATANGTGGVTYETVKASDVSYVNTASGLTATTVQGAIDQIVAYGNSQLNNITLLEENDGMVTLRRGDGSKVKVSKGDITYNATTGVYTFTNGDTTDVSFGGGDVTGGTEITVAGGTDSTFKNVTLGIADNAVTSAKIANGTIIAEDLAAGSVPSTKLIADGTNDAGKVATVNSNGTVTYQTIAADAANVTNGKALTSTDISVSGNGATALLKAVTIDIKPNAVTAAKINADVAGAGLSQNSTGALQIATDGVTAAMINPNVAGSGLTQDASGALQVNTAAIATGDITGGTEITVGNGADSAFKDVTLGIANNAITNAKMADDAIGSAEIINGSITGADIAANTITPNKFNSNGAALGTVATVGAGGVVSYVAPSASAANVTNGQPLTSTDLSVSAPEGATALLKAVTIDIKTGAVTNTKLAANSVDSSKIIDDSVTSADIKDLTITGADIATKTITADKLDAGTVSAATGIRIAQADINGNVTYSATVPASAIPSANLTAAADATQSIEVASGGTNAVLVATSLRVKDGGISTTKLADGAVTNVKIGADAITTDKIAANAVETSDIKDGAVTAAKLIADGANDAGKVATVNSNGTVTYQPVSTANLANKGSLQNPTGETPLSITIANGTDALLKNAQISVADSGITTVKLAADAVTNAKLADNAVQTENILNGTIIAEDLATGSVPSTKLIADGTNDAGKVATVNSNGTVTYQPISAANLTNGKALTSTDLSVSAPEGATALLKAVTIDIKPLAVTNGKLAGDAVDSSKILDKSVAAIDLTAGSVAPATGIRIAQAAIDGTVTYNNTIPASAIPSGNLTGADNAAATIEVASGGTNAVLVATSLRVKDNSITAAKLNSTGATDGQVAIANGSGGVAYGNVPAASVTGANLTNGGDASITIGGTGAGALLKNASVSVTDGGITNAKLAGNSVNSSNIIDNTILPADIASGGNDKVLTTGNTGTVTWADKSTLAIEPWQVQGGTTQASANGQNIYQAGNVGIGLASTDVPNTTDKLDVKGGNVRVRNLPATAGAAKDKVVVADSQGVLKTVNAAMSKVFYMPSVVFDTSVNGTFTKNLYQEYVNQFTGTGNPTLVSSPGAAPIPYYQTAGELDYHILYYDTTVFSDISISASGVLTYTIIGPGTEASFMNILFVVK